MNTDWRSAMDTWTRLTETEGGDVGVCWTSPAHADAVHPAAGDEVTIHVAGPLEEGQCAEAGQRQSLSVHMGSVACPHGWDMAISRMVRGDQCRLRCRKSYAQGTMMALGGDRRDAAAGRRLSRRLSMEATQRSARRRSMMPPSPSVPVVPESTPADEADAEEEPFLYFELELVGTRRLRRPARQLRWLAAVVSGAHGGAT